MKEPPFAPCRVAQWAEAAPHGIALRYGDEYVTWAEWHERIALLEGQLRKLGAARGTRVGLSMPVGEALLSTLLAIYRIGAVACPVNPQFPSDYRDGLLAPLDCGILIGEEGGPGACRNGKQNAPMYSTAPLWCLDAPATMIFTSGTTGAPKAAVLSLQNHLENARISNANIPLAPGDVWLLSLPMFHVAGFGVLFRCLVAGATIGLPEPGMPLVRAIEMFGATHISLVARQLIQLLDSGRHFSSLKAILLGGSAIPAALIDRALAADLPIHTSYGMTETASQIAATPQGATRAQLATSGRPLAPDAIRIGADECLQINGPVRFLGYWGDGTMVVPFDDDGWFPTSDYGHFDEDGFLHITGRRDNVFIAGGENIQPEEVERALYAIAGVNQAMVVPVPHPEFGTTPVAFVDCDKMLDEGRLRELLGRTLPRFKVPRFILPWPEDLAEGMKISRRALAERAEIQLNGHQIL